MKPFKALWILFMCGLSVSTLAQQDFNVHGPRFYEQLAHKDAAYEWELQKLSGQDELDYWADQSNFERHLGKANFPAYLAYMKGKKQAYKTYLKGCKGCSYSTVYLVKAREYLSVSDSEFLARYKTGNVVQNDSGKRKLN
ncbi:MULTISPECIES: hypothetical protein [Flavobacteriaceae]|uniref:hypothetical protein n=1 Tax=Flavobacteriaceae TaxID=49546 RepID=UPI00149182EC|nr:MULTISPECIES: hypothetical protein [Allomuricauda]MDC6366168.1 hypothetical protein [Muricauda sp. AC10]